MHMTACVREYASRARSQADGSGNVSRNHSWKTGGNLRCTSSESERQGGRGRGSLLLDFLVESVSDQSIVFTNRVERHLELRTLQVQEGMSVLQGLVERRTYPSADALGGVRSIENRSQDDDVRDPFDETALLVERNDRVRSNIFPERQRWIEGSRGRTHQVDVYELRNPCSAA
jgi:hypothetical protein